MTAADSRSDALERARSAVDALPPSWESTEARKRILVTLAYDDANKGGGGK